jgi:hypothetical protein
MIVSAKDPMSIHTVYRVSIWLPIVIPAILIVVVNIFRVGRAVGVVGEVLAYSLIYGGLPYLALAAWATWWIGGRSEVEIRRLMFRAPLLMLAAFVPLALTFGIVVGAVRQWAAVALLGSAVIVALGYTYVGLAVLLRHQFGPKAA